MRTNLDTVCDQLHSFDDGDVDLLVLVVHHRKEEHQPSSRFQSETSQSSEIQREVGDFVRAEGREVWTRRGQKNDAARQSSKEAK